MKVAVLGGFAPSLTGFRGAMMKAMVAAGHEVVGLAPEQDPAVEAQLAAMGVAFRAVPIGRTGRNPLEDLRTLRALTGVLGELKPDLLLSYTIKPVIYGSMAAARVGIPHRHAMITGLGSSLVGQGFKGKCMAAVAKWLYRRGLSKASGIFFQNPDDRAFFEAHRLLSPQCRVTMINGSGVDLDHFFPAEVPAGPATFLMVARLTRDKGLFEFVEAARQLKARFPEVRCQLLGALDSNPTAVSLEQVRVWEREGHIEYLGATKDVRPFLRAAHAVVLPSYAEGTPRSLLEAMAIGRAVVTTDAPGCRETVIEGKNGYLVPVKDATALAGAMARFIEEPALAARLGIASRAYAEEKFDVNKVNAVILQALGL
jgi:glycosyltransferase involved in cell wall biosynthesis